MSRYYDDELYHHGIKGMHWGVRRYQNRDGTYTSKGLQRRSNKNGVGKKLSKYYTSVQVSKYKDHGLDSKYARYKAEEKKQKLKKVAIVSGTAVAITAGVLTARYIGKNYIDDTIKAGTTIQTLSKDPDRLAFTKVGQQFYTNYRNSDKRIYEGLFGVDGRDALGNIRGKYAITAKAKENVKIASPYSGKKAFKELLNKDPDFRKSVMDLENTLKNEHPKLRRYKSGYDFFNAAVLPKDSNQEHGEAAKSVSKMFYDHLIKKGYGGVADINDMKYSNLRGNSPAIIFNRSSFGNEKASRLNYNRLVEANKYARKKVSRIKTADALSDKRHIATGAMFVASTVSYAGTVYDAKIYTDQSRYNLASPSKKARIEEARRKELNYYKRTGKILSKK